MKSYFKTTCVLVLGALISLVGYQLIYREVSSDTRFYMAGGGAYIKVCLLYASMLLGIVAKALHSQIEIYDKPSVTIRKLMKIVMQSKGFLSSIVVSPIVFFTVYNVTNNLPDNIISFLLSFQNGFFWRSIFEHKEKDYKDYEDT